MVLFLSLNYGKLVDLLLDRPIESNYDTLLDLYYIGRYSDVWVRGSIGRCIFILIGSRLGIGAVGEFEIG